MKVTVISEDVRNSIKLSLDHNENWVGKIENYTFSLTADETRNKHNGKPLVKIKQYIGDRIINETYSLWDFNDVMQEIQSEIRRSQGTNNYNEYIYMWDNEEDGVDFTTGNIEEIMEEYLRASESDMDGCGKILEYHPSTKKTAMWVIDKLAFKPITIGFMVINNATVIFLRKDGVMVDYFVVYDPAYYICPACEDENE